MSLKEKLELVLEANIGQFTSGMERAGASAEKELAKADGSMQKVGGRLQVTGAAMVGFGAVAVGAMGEAAEAYGKAEAANMKLENSVQNSTHSVGDSIGPFKDLAEKLQQTTEFSHTATENMESYLIQTGRTKDETLALTPAIQDLAAKMGLDLNDAAKKVTQALNGKKKGLEALIGPLDATTYATDRYKAVTDGLSQSVGGFATEQGKTFEGQLIILKNNLKELEEGVGKGATEAFSHMFSAVETVTGALNSLNPHSEEFIGQLVTYGSVGLIAAGAFNMIAGTVLKTASTLGLHTAAVEADTVAVDENATALLADGTAATAGAAAFGPWGIAVAAAIIGVSEAVDILGSKETHAMDVTGDLAKSGKDLADAFLFTADEGGPEDLAKWLDNMSKAGDAGAGALQRLRVELQGQGRDTTDVDAAIQKAIEAHKGLASATAEGTEVLNGANDATVAYVGALKDLHDEMHGELDPMFAAQKALQDNTKAIGDAEAATWKHQAAIDAATEATKKYGAGSKEANDANLVVIQTEGDLESSNMKVAESAMSVHDATEKLAQAMADGGTTIDGAKQQLAQWVAQGLMTQGQADQVAYALAGVANRADALDGRNIVMGLTLDVGQANAELNSIAARTNGQVPKFDVGGQVPGARGAPMPAIVHGGEYVMTADMVDAVTSGQGWSGGSSGGGFGGIVVNIDARGATSEAIALLPGAAERAARTLQRALV